MAQSKAWELEDYCVQRLTGPLADRAMAQAGVIARVLCGAEYAVFLSLFPPGTTPRGWSAARRFQPDHALRGVCVLDEGRAPRGAPSRRFQSSGPCFRAPTGGVPPALIRAAFAALRPRRVQPLKAAGPSAGGRLPEASRERGCEPRPRAPHLLHLENASRSAPH